MRYINPSAMYAYLAGRSAARRDAAMENARLRPESAQHWVYIAKAYQRGLLREIQYAKEAHEDSKLA
jgi:hypothetical protein